MTYEEIMACEPCRFWWDRKPGHVDLNFEKWHAEGHPGWRNPVFHDHHVFHDHLGKVTKCHPQDYEPWGKLTEEDRAEKWVDCSCGCVWYVPLTGRLGADWGVCTNPKSHRVGLLTFEHQGCLHGEVADEGQEPFYHKE